MALRARHRATGSYNRKRSVQAPRRKEFGLSFFAFFAEILYELSVKSHAAISFTASGSFPRNLSKAIKRELVWRYALSTRDYRTRRPNVLLYSCERTCNLLQLRLSNRKHSVLLESIVDARKRANRGSHASHPYPPVRQTTADSKFAGRYPSSCGESQSLSCP